jgi:hypothetical protein
MGWATAVAMAKKCPMMQGFNGQITVYETFEM